MKEHPEKTENELSEYLGIYYRLVRSPRRSISLTVQPEGVLEVRMPLLSSKKEAEEVIRRHRRWVLKRLYRVEKKQTDLPEVPKFTEEELMEIRKRAAEVIPGRVAYYAPLIGVSYGKISFRFQHTRWGSCTRDGNLSFNSLLVLCPPEVLDSVVVHELCHRKQMNHSNLFYSEVVRVFPEYGKSHLWLKKHGDELMNRLP